MANEITVRTGLQVRNAALLYQGMSQGFGDDQANIGGPTPGQIDVPLDGVNVDLSVLDTPGYCEMINLSTDHWIAYGPYDEDTGIFLPLFRLREADSVNGPKSVILDIYPYLGVEQGTGSGTGASGGGVHLRLKAIPSPGVPFTGSAKVIVNAFEE